jgi:hypothetical protein
VDDLGRLDGEPRRRSEFERGTLAQVLPSERRVDFDDEAFVGEEDNVLALRRAAQRRVRDAVARADERRRPPPLFGVEVKSEAFGVVGGGEP